MRTGPDTGQVVAAHERRLATLDPLLPGTHPLPDPRPEDAVLTADGAVAIARRERPDPATMEAIWGAADQHRLLPRVGGGPDPAAAMAALLAQWRELVAERAVPGDPTSEVVLTWPSRDATMAQVFLGYGLAPLAVVAARTDPWAWVADLDQPVGGLLLIDPPERAGWIAPLVSASPAAYLGTLAVTASRRGQGVGTALVREGHRALDAAGAAVTLLHYATLNPLSGPFWHRCGYRPLWTIWRVRPASSRLGAGA